MREFILASASPRRKELLSQIGIKFRTCTSKKEEEFLKNLPEGIVKDLSYTKARDVYERGNRDNIVIGADTIVVLDGEILGKPKDRADAKRMIRMLQGRDHKVYTGVAVLRSRGGRDPEEDRLVFHEMTVVRVFPMSDEEIERYVATGEADDKAGAYGIQGIFAKHVQGISGCYYNVMGLPIGRLYQELKGWLEA